MLLDSRAKEEVGKGLQFRRLANDGDALFLQEAWDATRIPNTIPAWNGDRSTYKLGLGAESIGFVPLSSLQYQNFLVIPLLRTKAFK